MSHQHVYRLIEPPGLTRALDGQVAYPREMAARIEGAYACRDCGKLSSVVYAGTAHLKHYLASQR